MAEKEYIYLLTKDRKFIKENLVLPKTSKNWVTVKFLYCGICGGDISFYNKKRKIEEPISLGHEFIGIIEDTNGSKNFNKGDIVTSDFNYRCGKCSNCMNGNSHLCLHGEIRRFSNRAFSSKAKILEDVLYILPQNDFKFTLVEPMSCALHATNKVTLKNNQKILILGAGSLGISLSFILKYKQRVSYDIYDINKEKLNNIKSLIEPSGKIQFDIQTNYDVIFDVSGSIDGLKIACNNINVGGVICSMSRLQGYGNTTFAHETLSSKDITFIYSYLNGNCVEETIKLINDNWNKSWQSIFQIFHVEDLEEAFCNHYKIKQNKTLIKLD